MYFSANLILVLELLTTKGTEVNSLVKPAGAANLKLLLRDGETQDTIVGVHDEERILPTANRLREILATPTKSFQTAKKGPPKRAICTDGATGLTILLESVPAEGTKNRSFLNPTIPAPAYTHVGNALLSLADYGEKSRPVDGALQDLAAARTERCLRHIQCPFFILTSGITRGTCGA
jgi:hypothetical protein